MQPLAHQNNQQLDQQQQQQGGLADIELQRQARIKRNRQVLCDLGLENAGQLMLGPKHKKQQKQQHSQGPRQQHSQPKQQLEPTRKSRRLKGDRPEIEAPNRGRRGQQQQDENDADGPQQPSSNRSRASSSRSGGGQEDEPQYSEWDGRIDKAAVEALLAREPDNPYHMHNIDRLRSMSCKALVTRVRRITNIGKLQSFVKVLRAAGGREEVLAAAEEALEQL